MIGAPSVSAQIVDEHGQYVDTVFHDNVDRMAEDSLGLGKDSVVDGILINTDLQVEVVDGVVMRGDSCETDTIRQTELKTSFFVGYCYDKNRTLKENIWDWTSVILIGMIVLCIIVIGFMHISFKFIKEKNVAIQIILILLIAFIAIYSDSHWAYLVLVVLCLLGVFCYNTRLADSLKDFLKSYSGQIKQKETTDDDKKNKEESEVEELLEWVELKDEKGKQKINTQHEEQKKNLRQQNREVKELVFDFLKKRYPTIRRFITYDLGLLPRYTFDYYVDGGDDLLLIETKYNPTSVKNYNLDKLYEVADFFREFGKQRANVLLLVVTDSDDKKQELLQYFNRQMRFDSVLQVKVYNKFELEEI